MQWWGHLEVIHGGCRAVGWWRVASGGGASSGILVGPPPAHMTLSLPFVSQLPQSSHRFYELPNVLIGSLRLKLAMGTSCGWQPRPLMQNGHLGPDDETL